MNDTYTLTLTTQNKTPMALTDYLKDELLIPRKVRHFLRTRQQVFVNEKKVPFHHFVTSGDQLQLTFLKSDYPTATVLLGKKERLNLFYEDEHLLVVNKPAGQKTHPNSPQENDTLLNDAASYLKSQGKIPYIVHRLDKETSGLVLLAKDPVVLPILGRMLEMRHIHRTYQAITTGKILEKKFTIEAPIARDRHDRRKRLVDKNGKPAITKVTVEKTTAHYSYVTCFLLTGRTHQIRVHLKSIGHPIVGDVLYNPGKEKKLALKAVKLEFCHPFTKKDILIETPDKLF